jgi:hypothetical protein
MTDGNEKDLAKYRVEQAKECLDSNDIMKTILREEAISCLWIIMSY